MKKRPVTRIFAALLCVASGAWTAGASAAQSDPDSAGNYGKYLAARLAASEHDMEGASRLYRAALGDDPDNKDLLARAFLYTAAAGDLDDAAELAARVVKQASDDRAARLTLAVAAMKHRDYSEAREHIEKSAKGPFTALTLALVDAWAAVGKHDTEAALKDIALVTTEGGSEELAAFHKASILDLAERNAEAEAAYKIAAGGDTPGPRAVDAYGRFLERNGRTADARALYEHAKSDTALEPVAVAGLARLDSGKKPDRLIASANQGAGEALFGIAATLSDKTSADIAILYLRLALSLSPDLDLAKIVLADRFEALEKYEDAIAAYRSVSDDSPYRSASEVQAAVDEGKLDQKDKAIADLKDLSLHHADDIAVWTALGDAYRATERWPEAADAYDRAIKTLPEATAKDWPLFYARGVAYERAHNWSQAEKDLQQALTLSPDQPQVLNYLGYSWVDQGKNLPKAMAMLERARALSPFDGYVVDSVGWAYYKLGKFKLAATTLENAVLLVPGDPTINDHLGDAYWKIGRKLDAHYQWSHALAFGPEAEEKSAIEKKLQESMSFAESNTAR